MKNTMALNKLSDDFSKTKTAEAFVAAIQSRVMHGREFEDSLSQSAVSPALKKIARGGA